jgi:hypothetical protein
MGLAKTPLAVQNWRRLLLCTHFCGSHFSASYTCRFRFCQFELRGISSSPCLGYQLHGMTHQVFPKPKKEDRVKPRKNLRPIGKVGRERLNVVTELTEQAALEGWLNTCEVCPVLFEHKLIESPRCSGSLTFAHSQKSHKRGSDPKLNREVARCCQPRHYFVLDLLNPELTRQIVLEAISRRKEKD